MKRMSIVYLHLLGLPFPPNLLTIFVHAGGTKVSWIEPHQSHMFPTVIILPPYLVMSLGESTA